MVRNKNITCKNIRRLAVAVVAAIAAYASGWFVLAQDHTVDFISEKIDALEKRATVLSDSIDMLKYNDSILCGSIARGLRQQHANRQYLSPLAFVSSASTVNEAIKRLSYIKSLQRAQTRKVEELREKRGDIRLRQSQLDSVQTLYSAALKELSTAKTIQDERNKASEVASTSVN